MNETAETLERALKNATNTINFWQQRAESAEVEAADLRQQQEQVLNGVRRYIETGAWSHLLDMLPEEEGWRER